MDMQSSSDSSLPKPGDLVWAKMRGFPPWPAKVLEKDKNTPLSRIPVIFFGTGEKAFMKPSDVFDYYENKAQYEIPRKHKGFNEAVHEIRVAAGFETLFDADPLFGPATSTKTLSPMLCGATHDELKTRTGTGKMLADVFLSGFRRRRADSASTRSRSRTSSSASALKKLHKAMHRRRMDSGSSAGSRRVKGLGGFTDRGLDLFDSFQCLDGTDFNVLDEEVNLLANDDVRSSRSKRSHHSMKLYDDLLLSGFSTRIRNRSGSASDGGKRSRLISGVSDVFDEIAFNNELNLQEAAEQLLHALEDIPSGSSEGRPGTPEAPTPLLNPAVFCTACGCECKSYDGKLRCTSKFCRKLNDSPDSHGSKRGSEHSISTTESSVTSSSKTEVKVDQKFFDHKEGQRPYLVCPKEQKKTDYDVLEQEKECAATLTSFSKSVLRKRKCMRSPPRRKVKKEELSDDNYQVPSKEAKPEKIPTPTPPRDLSLFSPTLPPPRSNDSCMPGAVTQKRNVRDGRRPRQYKVEKTPPISASGQRHCTFCNGQVRPQMCGSNRHRWRCVDKKCRKWYGWVKSNEEIPKYVGKRRRRLHSNRAKKVPSKAHKEKEEDDMGPASLSSQAEAALAAAEIQSIRSDEATDPFAVIEEENVQERKKRLGRPPKEHGLKIRLKGAKERKEETRQKRKYVRRSDILFGKNKSLSQSSDEKKPCLVPLTEEEMNFEPCGIEKRVRWWLSERRKVDPSPERSFEASVIDSCAAFRMLSQAFRATAVTRADEAQSVSGALDILMDSLMGSFGPLLTVASIAFKNLIPDDLAQMLWNSSAVHIPTFQ
ncbi:hypothetical protein KIN20_035572 [Parelaphostrongylus tenuis]|uniref:PWWP domain-containing protein n=1 Tax=Parelaphostrongylus tenuis TaxID=148309 RepID=A0AAD5WJT4_PARTN|nr:hypothetical protein KIN20_035572 [Parelaphostrongylus tenuis]